MKAEVEADRPRCGYCDTQLALSEAEGLCPRCLIALAVGGIDLSEALIAPGDRVGPYEILGLINRGGMGEVYRARDTRLDRIVALKLLSPGIVDGAARRERFEREARAASSLNHPNICSLYDVGEQDDTPFLVIEYVEGETLAQRLAGGALPTDQVLRCSLEIVDALEHAHSHGVIHRDLKPANIMLTRAGVKLLDFGVAKLEGRAPSERSPWAPAQPRLTVTEDGAVVGTLQYMAPEQVEARDADARTDIFGLGVVVYEMATGRHAFAGPSRASVADAILHHHPEPCSAVNGALPARLDEIVARCLAKNPADRWQTASDLKQALTELAGAWSGGPAAASTTVRRMPRGWVTAAAIALIVISTAIVVAMMASRHLPSDAASFRFIVPPPENGSFSQSSAFMAVSPDGQSLAFVASSREHRNALWVRSLDSLDARPLPGTDDAGQPFWSPDGRFLAFSRTSGADTLYKIDVVGGLPQAVAGTRAGPGTWNDEGSIFFLGDRERALYRVPSNGGTPTPVTTLDRTRAETRHAWPQLLPDNRHFIFLARSANPEHEGVTYVGSLDSAERVRLVAADSHAVYAPQGYLLFMRVNTLLAQPFDPATLRLTGEPVPLAERVERTPGSLRGAFSISQTGVLAYRPIAETLLAWYDRGGKPLRTVGPPGPYSNPALSPDEQRIAVGRLDFETGASDIWLIDQARGDLASRLTSDAAPEDMPLFSPDGSHIVFTSGTDLRQKLASGAGSGELLLSGRARSSWPGALGWSHDGESLLYHTRPAETRLDVWVKPMAGDRAPFALLQTRFQEGYAQVSPDGRWIAYVSDESGRNEIYVRSLSGGEGKRQLSTEGGLEPMWRSDGQELFYLAPNRNLMSVRVKAGPTFESSVPTLLFETRMSPAFNPTYTRNQYVVSKDGQRFLINQPPAGAPSPPITVVVNWPAMLKR